MKMPPSLHPLVAAQLLLWGPFECWRLVRARRALHRLAAAHDRRADAAGSRKPSGR